MIRMMQCFLKLENLREGSCGYVLSGAVFVPVSNVGLLTVHVCLGGLTLQYNWLSKPLSFTSPQSTNQGLNLQVSNPKMQRANCIHRTAPFYIGT